MTRHTWTRHHPEATPRVFSVPWRGWLMLAALGLLMALQWSISADPARALPPDFEDTFVANVSGPIDLAWTPDGRMLIAGKNGELRVYANGSLLSTPALDLASVLCTNGERGLVSIAVHPNFAVNHYIYLFYTFNKFPNSSTPCAESETDGPVNRVSRFVLNDTNVIDPSTEFVLFNGPPMYKDHHTGGDMEFGSDGYLYVTVGDTGAQSLGYPQDMGKLAGKIVRVTDTGGIPADNPFVGVGTARCNVDGVPPSGSPAGTQCQEIYALGLRNPFRFAFDPNAAGVRFYIHDVGQHTWEEISEGQSGANYGWPVREGPCVKDSDTDCGPPPAGMTNPTYWYHHGVDGAAVTGGAFVPDGVWPNSLDGSYLFADYVFGNIYQITPSTPTGNLDLPPLVFTAAPETVSMRFGPHGNTQALYYVTRNGSQVRRIAFTGTLNRSPVARPLANPTYGPLPLTVNFDGTTSSDPDGDPLTYAWDFDANGTTDSTTATASHTYNTAGTFFAKLTVNDGNGGTDSATVRIDSGNTPPVPVIETPPEGTLFAVGESFTLHGSATDGEDGALADTALTWEMERQHATHTHPFVPPTPGNDVPFTAPEPEDLDAASDSFLRIFLTVTDSNGLSATVSREIHPKRVNVTFETVPSGLTLTVSGETITGPTTVQPWENYNLLVNAPAQTDSSGDPWVFDFWSDGGAQTHTITTPSTPATYTATFKPGDTVVTTLTFNAVADTYASSAQPTRNFGTRSTLRTDASPDIRSYLRFQVDGLGASVTSAVLRVYANTGSSVGYNVHGLSNPVADGNWAETTLNYSNMPPIGPVVDSSGPFSSGTFSEVDVTSLVTGDGLLTLVMTSTHTTATSFASREAGVNAPQLVITAGGVATGDTEKPTKPANLLANSVTPNEVSFTWDASTDNVGVTGYDIFRDGVFLETIGPSTTYTDNAVVPSTPYQYQARARDGAGNLSDLSDPLLVMTPASGPMMTFTPADDTYIKFDSPGTNFGSASSLQVDNSPIKHMLLKFVVSGVGAQTVTTAKLRLYVLDSSGSGGDFHLLADPNAVWSEGTVTWSNAPAADPAVVASLGGVTTGTWVEVDLTSVITGDATFSLRVTSPSTNGADYSSTEGTAGFAPQLLVTVQ